MGKPDFYYALAYCLLVIIFGIRRMRRRRTPYVTAQTLTLTAIQVIPLFLLPYLLLPWMGNNGWFDSGPGQWMANVLFPADASGERAYWHAFGLILAWPLFVYNVFTGEPLWGWLAISFLQTFVLIPWMVLRWGKGAYCGWICSCGALAETLGDAHRHKMPHGPLPNRLNMIGQVFLGLALLLLVFRLSSWIPGLGFLEGPYYWILSKIPVFILPVLRRFALGRHSWLWTLFSFLRTGLVPFRLSSGRADAYLFALHEVPHLCGQVQVHLLQRLHYGMSPRR
ncbi:MAG TPA: 4Fe-4S binding protein [Verrucomicrobiales bacterium]|nr:4Fe-4S binding protein [Verrucomicrobiales bacterium]